MTHHTASTQELPVIQPVDQIVGFLHELLRPLPADGQTASAPRGRGRPRELQSDHLWLAMLVAILRGFTGFASVWRLITWTAVGGFPLLALDQSTLDAVRRCCEDVRHEAKDSPRLLVGKLAGFFDVRRQQWVRLLFRDDVFANEKSFVEEVLAGIQAGTLILTDLGYFSFPWFDRLGDLGCWWLSRLREKTSDTREHVFVQQGGTLDALIWLGAYRAGF